MTGREFEEELGVIAAKVKDTTSLIKQLKTKLDSVGEALDLAKNERTIVVDRFNVMKRQDLIDIREFILASNDVELYEQKVWHIESYSNSETANLNAMESSLSDMNRRYGEILKLLETCGARVIPFRRAIA
jgi:hypothetical protein